MPAARHMKNVKKADDGEESQIFDLSQRSMSSDDGMMRAVAQQMQSTWEKKRKEKETRFLQAAKGELDNVMSAYKSEFAENLDEINTLFEKFAMDYATVEDEIRKLWVGIGEEQAMLKALCEKKQISVREDDKERERAQVQAMARVKRACEDQERLIRSLEASASV